MKARFWKAIASLSVLLVPFLFLGFPAAQDGKAQPKGPKGSEIIDDDRIDRSIAKGQILVTLHQGVKPDDLKPIFERLEAKFEIVDRIDSMNFYALATDHERLPELKQRLENHPYVASSAFNGVASLDRIFNDPIFKKPKDKAEDKDNWNLYRINVPDAWDITTGGAPVAIIDTGAKLDHEELVGRTSNPYSFATRSEKMQEGMKKIKFGAKNYRQDEVRNHGTHVAVTIGGKADNGVGVAGVAPSSPLMPLQALSYTHTFPDEDAGRITDVDSNVYKALALAMDRNVSVINMSLGYIDGNVAKKWREAKTDLEKDDLGVKLLAKSEEHLKAVAPFLDRANRMGTILVVSAGNETVPAEFSSGLTLSRRAINIAATTRADKRADFSNFGAFTTVSAPGHEIWSGFAEEGKPYSFLSGTSMAAPHASGVVALMKTIDPGLKHADVAAILIATGRKLETDLPIGPLINAKAALEEVRRREAMKIREPEVPPLIIPPEVNPTDPKLPEDGVEILRRPNPWNNPNVRRIIQLWLAFATPIPPAGGPPNVRWFFNNNGQVVNNRTLVTTPRPVWAPLTTRWLWENAAKLDSTNMGSLYEFTVGTLRTGKFDPAPTRVPENVRPRKTDPQPNAKGLPFDPKLGDTKWTGKTAKGDKIDFDFGPKVVTITRDGKAERYIARLNTHANPVTIDFYPEAGGDPIRGLLKMNDLGEISLRTDFTKIRPTTMGPGDSHTLKRTDLAPAAVAGVAGFGDGDGALVHADVANAKVGDWAGTPRATLTHVEKGLSFIIIRCENPGEATKYMDLYRKGYEIVTKAKAGTFKGAKGPWTLAIPISSNGANRVTVLRTIDNAGSKNSYYLDAGVHRERYFIRIEGSNMGLERMRPAYEKATKLIDERFPKE